MDSNQGTTKEYEGKMQRDHYVKIFLLYEGTSTVYDMTHNFRAIGYLNVFE